MTQINIQFSAGNAVQKVIPVVYAVENKEGNSLKIFRCMVDLPLTQIPSWLPSEQFDLVAHVRDEIQFIDYFASGCQGSGTPESDSFRYKVYAEIFFNEQKRTKKQAISC